MVTFLEKAEELLNKTKAKLLGRQQKRAADFAELVQRIVSGKKATADEIGDELEAMGLAHSPDEVEAQIRRLHDEVQRIAERREYAAKLATIPAIDARLEEIGDQLSKLGEEFRPIRDKYETERRQLIGTAQWEQQKKTEAESMRAKLIASYTGPLTTELAENRERQAELNREIFTARKTAEKHEHEMSFMRPPGDDSVEMVRERGQLVGVVGESTHWHKVKDIQSVPVLPPDEIETKKETVRTCRARIGEFEKQIAELVQREAQILEEMLLP